MDFSVIYCPGAPFSQSGSAVKERYPNTKEIKDCGGIGSVPITLNDNNGPYTIPIWNSNQGEIKAAEYVWNLIEDERIKILDIWPKSIDFWFVKKLGNRKTHGLIGSVGVAETQCSEFLKKMEAKIKPYDLTTDALIAYKSGARLDGVLVAPDQCHDDKKYEVACKETANSNNFTSFVTLTPAHLKHTNNPAISSYLTGVTMGSLSDSVLEENQATFFEQVFTDTFNLKDIPKLIFVFKRTAKVGLLFEGERFSSGDFLDAEELEAGDILIHEDVGELELAYTQELDTLITEKFSSLKQHDFILHQGKNTFLFACPALGMYTHGYDKKAVEPVVRLYIDKIFEFIDNEGICSKNEKTFFNRHHRSWKEKRSDFMKFTIIDYTA